MRREEKRYGRDRDVRLRWIKLTKLAIVAGATIKCAECAHSMHGQARSKRIQWDYCGGKITNGVVMR